MTSPSTELLCLKDTFQFECDAELQEVKQENERIAVVLNKTIAYPQGGGQPCDHGVITFNNNVAFHFSDCRLDANGLALHFGAFPELDAVPSLASGTAAHVTIDKERRLANARNHSGGHLIDCAFLGTMKMPLVPGKGHHFPGESYIEYKGVTAEPQKLKDQLQNEVDRLGEQSLPIVAKELTLEEAAAEGHPAPPMGKHVRVVSIADFAGCGCGGTHLSNTKQIGKITIKKISSKKGVTRVSYLSE